MFSFVHFEGTPDSVSKEADMESLLTDAGTLAARICPIIMDVTKKTQIEAALVKVQRVCEERGLQLAGIVNNAGYGRMERLRRFL